MEVLKQEVENNLSSGPSQEQGEDMAQEERQDAPQKLRLTMRHQEGISRTPKVKERACKGLAFRAEREKKPSAREVHLISFGVFSLVVLILFLFEKILITPEQRKKPEFPPDTPANYRARLKD